MPVYNRAAALQVAIGSYLQQRHLHKIVLVDDGSSDSTPQVMANIRDASPVPVHIIRHPYQMGQPQARLSALAALDLPPAASGEEWVLFGEDDVVLAPDYIETLLRDAHSLHADIIAGRLINIAVGAQVDSSRLPALEKTLSAPATPAFDLTVFRADYHARAPEPVPAPFLHTVALIRRAVFQDATFDPGYGGNAVREETDFYLAAGAAGYRLFFSPHTVCYHLRGPLANTGGQRSSRLKMEYWNLVNTRRLVSKHWHFLQMEFGFTGTPGRWMLGFIFGRYGHVLHHILHSGSLRPKDRT